MFCQKAGRFSTAWRWQPLRKENMNVLVVGGAGYIGSHIVLDLMEKGHRPTVFDNLSSGSRTNLFKDNPFIHGDIMRQDQITAAIALGFDAVIHLAAFKAAGESMIEPHKYSVNNLCGTINLLGAMLETGCKHMVFSSSAAVYGEPSYLPIDEEHPKKPENYYGFTKLKIEEFLEWYGQIHGLSYANLRYFNAAGYDPEGRIQGLERNPANLLPIVMEAAKGWRQGLKVFGDDYPTEDGTCIRDYVHVSDLARAHTLALEHLGAGRASLTVNLGSENGISVKTMAETAKTITGVDFPVEMVERRPGDPAKLVASSQRAKDILGWEAKYSSAETLLTSTWQVYSSKEAPE
jgi:UDP-glucose 4-epimerase